jgi:hypothetical protein
MLAGMTTRGEVRDAILAISLNDDLADRADAVWCLVRFIGEVEVDRRIVALARHSEDTYVTEAAFEALSFRGDLAAWSLIAEAYGANDDDHTRAHMTDALQRTVLQDWTRSDEARGHLSTLQMSPEPEVRGGAIELAAWVADQLEAPKAQRLVSHKRWRRLFG